MTGRGGSPASWPTHMGRRRCVGSMSLPAALDMSTPSPRCARCCAVTRRPACALAAVAYRLAFPGGPVLLVTNDFPPRRGGIQSYLEELVRRIVGTGSHAVTVYAPQWKGADAFDAGATGYRVVRHPGTLMLPGPAVDTRMRRLIAEHDIDTVWFGAAAPLALLADRARQAGRLGCWPAPTGMRWAGRCCRWPLGVAAHRRQYRRRHVRQPLHARPVRLGVRATAALEYLPPGVDTDRFRPDPASRARLRPATVWADGPRWYACRGWSRARVRTS
ncbi:GDP-mannose-dependent alpha-(1-6)-phosphatidylinositol monomannoside mannosyltransferase [Mycobacterium xenopi 4042]|uniref:GDP-mannose-dependent alpha-(1-6)-phosphatidylinositol monomannoside mannosyltransferase n=1 Tax=Mycobacterium xenopi 4042 TaxID=1299334 RepID=X7ZYX9_MYCXE|nr:GDP-mannose-dependent alpha-(1-6)-phosphatidylinositol monomannoside mannosyltransferase [Mycobacterium xenopi 4042]